MTKNYNKIILISLLLISLVLIAPIVQSFFYPIELEVRESTLWMHILTMKAGINIYDSNFVAFANQAHGPFDPIIKLFISWALPFLEPWQVSRSTNVLLFISIFIVNFSKLRNIKSMNFIIFLSILIYSMLYLLTKNYQGRADVTAMFFLSVLLFLCSDRKIYVNNINIILVSIIASFIILSNWRFFPICLGILFYPMVLKNSIFKIFTSSNVLIFLKVIFFSLIPFLLILFLFFNFKLDGYLDYFVRFFYFESFFSFKHFYIGFLHLIRVEKIYFISLLLFLINYKIYKEIIENSFNSSIKILFSILVFLTCTVSFLYNFSGGGIYYFTPLVFLFWFLIIDSVKNIKDLNFEKRTIPNISFFLISFIIIVSTLKSNILSSFSLYNSKDEAQIVHNYLKELSKNPKTLSESLHFQKNKYTDEIIDIGDLLSYRSSQIGGNYEALYKRHLDNLRNQKYDYIIHNYTGSKEIDDLINSNKYEIIRLFNKNYSNIGDVLILKKNILSK